MAQMVTRCPKCSTSFRMTPAQLQTAKGAVRCGSCLHIFKAQDHLISPPKSDASTATKAPTMPRPQPDTSTPAPTSAIDNSHNESDEDDDILISDDDEADREEMLGDDFDIAPQKKAANTSLFDRVIEPEKNSDPDGADESWAINLLDNDDDTPVPFTRSGIKNDTKGSPDTSGHNTPPPVVAPRPKKKNPFMLIEDEPPQPPHTASKHTPKSRQSTPSSGLSANEIEMAKERAALLSGIQPEPLEFQHAGIERTWLPIAIWGVLSALAAIGLLVQLAILKFDSHSRIEPYRSYYASACQIVGCTLPSLIDRQRIRTQHLVVRDHPRVDNALQVDMVLLNTAPFDQPFPPIGLSFSDTSDTPVAGRIFLPSDYLGGEMAGRTIMPKGQPVHLSLEIKDPGENALSYRAFIPNAE